MEASAVCLVIVVVFMLLLLFLLFFLLNFFHAACMRCIRALCRKLFVYPGAIHPHWQLPQVVVPALPPPKAPHCPFSLTLASPEDAAERLRQLNELKASVEAEAQGA